MNHVGINNDEILSFCREPKSTTEIRDYFGMKPSTLKARIRQMEADGMIERLNVRKENASKPNIYQATEQKREQYKPLGMCIMGVWL